MENCCSSSTGRNRVGMNEAHFRDVSEAVLASMTEAEMAQRLRERGMRVLVHRGRYWAATYRGFYEPVHWLAGLTADEAVRPAMCCWGFRSTLHESAAEMATASMPVYLMSNLRDYSFERLPAKRRTDLRKCRKQTRIVQIIDPQILVEQGFAVAVSSARRIGRVLPASQQQYREKVGDACRDDRRVLLAGVVDDKLAGYLSGYAVDNVAYVESVVIATESLPTAVGTGLVFDFVEICRRSTEIDRIVYGQHSLEDDKLTFFKEGMGFPVTHIPCRVWMAPFVSSYLRWRHRYKFYRLTGKDVSCQDR